jgi:hypothetical protein
MIQYGEHGNESVDFIRRWLKSSLAECRVAAQRGFRSMNLVIQLDRPLYLCITEHLETLKRLRVFYKFIFLIAYICGVHDQRSRLTAVWK